MSRIIDQFWRNMCQKMRKDVDYKLLQQFFQKYQVIQEQSAVENSFSIYVCYAPDGFYWMNLYTYFSGTFLINVRYETGDWHPEYQTNDHHCTDDVVFEKFEHRVDIEIINKVPNTFNHVLHGSFTLTLKYNNEGFNVSQASSLTNEIIALKELKK